MWDDSAQSNCQRPWEMPGIPKIITILWTLTCPGCPADVGSPMGISGTRHPETWGAELQPPSVTLSMPRHPTFLEGTNTSLPCPTAPTSMGGCQRGAMQRVPVLGTPQCLPGSLCGSCRSARPGRHCRGSEWGVPKCCGAGPHGQGRGGLGPASVGLAVGTRSGMG